MSLKEKLMEQGLTLRNYKEPLREVPKKEGFGYYGAILGTIDGQYIQCHICGKYFANSSAHIRQAHKTPVPTYREKFELARQTALVSEVERERLKNNQIKFIASLTPQQLAKYQKKAIENRNIRIAVQPKLSLESKNKRGTCPDQLLDKIKEVAEKIGRTPSKHEFIGETGTQRYIHLIYKVYGSWTNALKILGMSPKQNGNKKNQKIKRYSNDELLEYLNIFWQENNKIPTATDFKRGLLPTYEVYLRRFGSITRARQLAGVPESDFSRKGKEYIK